MLEEERTNAVCNKWTEGSGVMCVKRVPTKQKVNIHKTLIKPDVLLYGEDVWIPLRSDVWKSSGNKIDAESVPKTRTDRKKEERLFGNTVNYNVEANQGCDTKIQRQERRNCDIFESVKHHVESETMTTYGSVRYLGKRKTRNEV